MSTSKPFYRVLATLLQRHRTLSNAIGTGDYTPAQSAMKIGIEDQLSTLLEARLPKGSGFNAGCVLLMGECDSSVYRFPGRLAFQADFDHGDQGWSQHQVHCVPTWDGFDLVVTGPNRNEIKAYIREVFGEVLESLVPTLQMKNYRVTWSIDAEAESPLAAAQQVADKYFQPRIAAGEPGTACVFNVVDTKNLETAVVDLSPQEGV